MNNFKKSEDYNKLFSKCFKKLREEKEITQRELAETIGISRQSVNSIEKGKSLPSIDLAFDIANFFNKSLDEFFRIDNEINNIINNSPYGEKGEKMNELSPFKHFRETMSLREAMDKLFEDSFIAPDSLPASKSLGIIPAADMYETDKDIVAEIHMPGYSENDVNLEVGEDAIYISGEKKQKNEEKKKNFYRREISYGSFSRTLPFPVDVNHDKAKANFKDGVLEIVVPKKEVKKSKTFKLKINKEK